MKWFKLSACIAVVCLVALATDPAEAAFKLRIDDPTTAGIDVEIDDADADGFISHSGTVGSFDFQVTGAFAHGGPPGQLGYATINITATTAGVLDVAISMDGYPDQGTLDTLMSTLTGDTDGTVWGQCGIDEGNTLFGFDSPWDPSGDGASDVLVAHTGTFHTTGLQGAFINTDFDEVLTVGVPTDLEDFSMTQVARIIHTSGFQVTKITYDNEMIPEPATCVIWSLLGLLGIGFARWRRRKLV